MKPFSDHVLDAGFAATGTNLVEASAGTGKTYSIQTLFLRLVVVHGIPVQRLLVVTFTEAATKELRERLRGVLEKCRRYTEPDGGLPAADADHGRIEQLMRLPIRRAPDQDANGAALADGALRASRIRRALLDFDQAAVFTIHGFCQRVLQEFAFECRHDFDAEVIDADPLLAEVCTDWWRRVVYGAGREAALDAVSARFPDARRVFDLASAYIRRPGASLLPAHDPASCDAARRRVLDALHDVPGLVRDAAADIQADLAAPSAAPFFTDGRREEIQRRIDTLRAVDTDRRTAFTAILELADELSPATIANPHGIPSPAQACIDACRDFEQQAGEWSIKPRGGDWGCPPEHADAWRRTVQATLTVLTEHRDDLDGFLDVVRANPDAFNKTGLADPAERKQRFDALAENATPSKMRTAIKRIAALKAKSKLSWVPSATTASFRKQARELREAADALCLVEVAAGMQTAAARFDQRKRDEHGMTFDDMLVRVQHALQLPATAARLRAVLRERYRAALVDEFQDTDAVQYRIFETIFSDGQAPLFFVGDPKQAIYSFRGGDIFTYCAAKARVPVEQRYSLDTNYRSQAPLIDAVNAIFRNRDGESLFGRPDIPYDADLGCNDLDARFVDDGELDTRPFKVWDYRKPEGAADKKVVSYGATEARALYGAVAEEIVRLLGGERTGFVDRDNPNSAVTRVQPSDIAILVRRHAEAAFLYRELRRRGVPAIRQAGDNIFDAPEATELLYVLEAMASPGHVPTVRTALASTLMPVTDDELAALNGNTPVAPAAAARIGAPDLPHTLDDWVVLFRDAYALWNRAGFSAAFNRIATHTGLKAWLAAAPDGERGMVNVTQLQDLLHRAAAERQLGPEALIGWLHRQLDADTREQNDAFETRLESDADAVQIMTVFKSKGLEFPVVFVPTMWTSLPGRNKAACHVYHDEPVAAQTDDTTAADAASGQLPRVVLQLDRGDRESRDRAAAERAQEDVRNLYVAATRGTHRTYVVAGELGEPTGTTATCLPRERFTESAKDPQAAIDVVPCAFDSVAFTRWRPDRGAPPASLGLAGPVHVDHSRAHASFSSIAPHGGPDADGDAYDFDAVVAPAEPEDAVADGDARLDTFSFPAGARTGECWHRVFEQLDFRSNADEIREAVDEQLGIFRLDGSDEAEREARRNVTAMMVRRVLDAPLHVEGGGFRLADVAPASKRAEVAFDFPLRPGHARGAGTKQRNAVWRVLMAAWKDAEGDDALFRERLRDWDQIIPGGFMTGFIDLLFEHAGRYYVLDWKSNRLDGRAATFDRERGLAAEMARHAYFLQYLLYTAAAHRFLRQCLGAQYDYATHFGGVLYVFVRGVGTAPTPDSQRGIYYTRPSGELIEALATALMPDTPGEGGLL